MRDGFLSSLVFSNEALVNRVIADAHALLRQVTIDIRLLS